MIRFEEKFAKRAERLKQIVIEAEEIDKRFIKILNAFVTRTSIFDGTKTALLTGSGELELF